MSKLTHSGAITNHMFLEHHFYSNGIRTAFYSASPSRPTWAPNADYNAVGFRNEVELADTDCLIELAKFKNGQDAILWIGVYNSARDQVLNGDRGYHSGLGVWLLNRSPTDPSTLVDALNTSLREFDEANRKGTAVEFQPLISFLNEQLTSFTQLAGPMGGLIPPDEGLALDTVKYVISDVGDTKDQKIDDFFAKQLYLRQENERASRALLLLTNRIREPVAIKSGFEILGPIDIKREVLSSLPSCLASRNGELEKLKNDSDEKIEKISSLNQKVAELESELAGQRDRATVSEREYEALKNSLQQNDERKRYHSLLEEVSGQARQLNKIINDLNGIGSEIRSIRKELRITQVKKTTRTPDYPPTYDDKAALKNLRPAAKSSWARWLFATFAFILFISAIILAITYGYLT